MRLKLQIASAVGSEEVAASHVSCNFNFVPAYIDRTVPARLILLEDGGASAEFDESVLSTIIISIIRSTYMLFRNTPSTLRSHTFKGSVVQALSTELVLLVKDGSCALERIAGGVNLIHERGEEFIGKSLPSNKKQKVKQQKKKK